MTGMPLLESDGREHKTYTYTREPISFGATQLDNFSGFYCFVYIDLLQGK
jgi:hypothetical protein